LNLNLNHGVRLYQFSVVAQRELWSNRKWEGYIGGSLGLTLRDNTIDTPSGNLNVSGESYQGGTFDITGLVNQEGLSDQFFQVGLETSLLYRLSPKLSAGLSVSGLKYFSTATSEAQFDISLSELSSGLILRYSF